MNVIKKSGRIDPFDISKIKKMIDFSCAGLDVNPLLLESKINLTFRNNIKTTEIQQNLIGVCLELISIEEPDWVIVAGRLTTKLLHSEVYKNTKIEYTEYPKFLDYAIKHNYYRDDIVDYYNKEEIEYLGSKIDSLKDAYTNKGFKCSITNNNEE